MHEYAIALFIRLHGYSAESIGHVYPSRGKHGRRQIYQRHEFFNVKLSFFVRAAEYDKRDMRGRAVAGTLIFEISRPEMAAVIRSVDNKSIVVFPACFERVDYPRDVLIQRLATRKI